MSSNLIEKDISIVVLVVSDIFTKEMLFNAKSIEKVGGLFVWIRLLPNENRRSESDLIRKCTNVFTLNYPKHYQDSLAEPKLYWAVDKIEHSFGRSSWFFWVDDDEILSGRDWRSIAFLTKVLPKNALYAFPRVWVSLNPRPFRVRSARSQRRMYDWQFRLFHSEELIAPSQIPVHMPIKQEVNHRIVFGVRIIHFGYKSNATELSKKLAEYESWTPNSALSKKRYYFPEQYTNFKFLKLKNFAKLRGLTRKTVQHFLDEES